MKNLLRIILITVIAGIGNILYVIPAFAISNPDSISFGTDNTTQYAVFENVNETGDILFIAEGFVYYATEPTDYDANEAFLFQVLDTDNTTVLISRPINDYGDRPISIYQSATQVTALGLVGGTGYVLRICGSPSIFPTLTGNSVSATLTVDDYIDQSIGKDSVTPTDNELRNFCILMAQDIQDYDTPTSDYITPIQGYNYLTTTGGQIFVEGIPNLYNFCPILFQYGASKVEGDEPESTGTYASVLSPLNKWGTTTANGLTNIGVYLGINQALAGSVVLFILVILLAVYIYNKTQSGVTVLLMVSATPFLGGFLGLMPIALAFVFTILIAVLMAYYFFSRGTL